MSVRIVMSIVAAAVLVGVRAQAAIIAPNYVMSEIATPSVPVGGVAVVGDAFFFGAGSFGGATQSIVRVDGGGSTVIADGFNGVAGFAYDALNDRLLVGDNFAETPGSVTGDTIFAIPDPLGPVAGAPPSASTLEALPAGSVPGVSDVALDPNDPTGNRLFVTDASGSFPPNGRILGVDLDTGNIDVLQSGLVKFAAGIAANDTSLFFGQAELFPAAGGDVSVVPLPGTGSASTLTAGLAGQADLVLAGDGTLLASASEFGGASEVVRIDAATGDVLEVVASGFDFATGIDEENGVIYVIEGGSVPQNRILAFTPVPEPGTFALLALGLAGLRWQSRGLRS
jgi:hypothetical protein